MKTCIRIQRITLSKSRPHRLVRSNGCIFASYRDFIANLVKGLDNSTVQIAFQQIIASLVARHVAVSEARGKDAISLLQLSNRRCLKKIEAFPRIDDGTNYANLAYVGRLMASQCFKRKLVSATRAGLPEVNARTQPVKVVSDFPQNRVARENLVSYFLFRAMKAKDESRQNS